jgi:putative ABC transport system permease protein
MQLVAGTDLTEEDVKRTDKPEAEMEYAFILNVTAAKKLGWKPEEAIGQKVAIGRRKGPVKAVVKDFHFASLHEAIGPLVIFPEKQNGGKMMVKLSGNDLSNTLRFMESKWKTLAPHRPFEYQFLDEEFADMYSTEQRVGQLFSTFAFLAIFLACLGLFGLAAFTTVQRTKEIGIRKVLGATVTSIVALLSKDFLQLVLLANVLAWPLAWYAMHRWLEDFVYRINIGWWIFGIAALAVLLITLLTVSYQAIKAALTNPIKSLRTE